MLLYKQHAHLKMVEITEEIINCLDGALPVRIKYEKSNLLVRLTLQVHYHEKGSERGIWTKAAATY
jgi:hypothetical protein